MTRLRTALAALLAAAFLLGGAGVASADEATQFRYSSTTITVVAGPQLQGSGWQLDRAISVWNAAQSTVRFVRSTQPGAATVYVHRYRDKDADEAGFTSYDLGWLDGAWAADGAWEYARTDVWLDDALRLPKWDGDHACWATAVVSHELGHALGLPHNLVDDDSLMTPLLDSTHYCNGPTPVDVRTLGNLYGA